MPQPASVLALDAGSPTVSVALAIRGEGGASAVRTAERAVEIGRSSRRLLPMIDEVLAEAGLRPAELGGLVALAGPGSFTGLRIGLATVLGLHQATGVPAVAVPTLEVLALAPAAGSPDEDPPPRIVAAVDVLRGEWAAQAWRTSREPGGGDPAAEGAAERLPAGELAARLAAGGPVRAIGFGVGSLSDAFHRGARASDAAEPRDAGEPPDLGGRTEATEGADGPGRPSPGPLPPGIELAEPPPLAAVAARRAVSGPWHPWSAGTLTAPIYFRPPAATLPRPRR